MTVLPDHHIRRYVLSDELIDPYDEKQLQPSSYDCRLSSKILVPSRNHGVLDIREPMTDDMMEEVDISDGFLIASGEFVLGSTVESVHIPSVLVGIVVGKSSRARQGMQIESAGYLDPGFHGNVTLEIVNFWPRPMRIWSELLIAQLRFEELSARCERLYSNERNHYQDSVGVVASRYGHAVHRASQT
jgi:dCTP deaminase